MRQTRGPCSEFMGLSPSTKKPQATPRKPSHVVDTLQPNTQSARDLARDMTTVNYGHAPTQIKNVMTQNKTGQEFFSIPFPKKCKDTDPVGLVERARLWSDLANHFSTLPANLLGELLVHRALIAIHHAPARPVPKSSRISWPGTRKSPSAKRVKSTSIPVSWMCGSTARASGRSFAMLVNCGAPGKGGSPCAEAWSRGCWA